MRGKKAEPLTKMKITVSESDCTAIHYEKCAASNYLGQYLAISRFKTLVLSSVFIGLLPRESFSLLECQYLHISFNLYRAAKRSLSLSR